MKSNFRSLIALLVFSFAVAGLMPAASVLFSITSGTPPNVAVNSGYPTFTFTANDAACPSTTYSFASTDIPAFLSLASSGQMTASGTGATAAGAYTFHVTVNDSCTQAMPPTSTPVTVAYTIQVSSPGEYYFQTPSPFTQRTVTIESPNGGTSVTCNNAVATDPCYQYDTTQDLTLDRSGNFVFTAHNSSGNGGPPFAVVTLPQTGITASSPLVVDVLPAQIPSGFGANPDFTSAVVDSGGNFIVFDAGDQNLLFCPPGGGQCSVVATGIAYTSFGLIGGYVRIDRNGNYVVASNQSDVNANPEIQFYKFPPCNPSTLVCPAPVSAGGAAILTGTENSPTGPIEGALVGLTIDSAGNYYITSEGDANQAPGVYQVNPTGPVVSVFYTDATNLPCPGGITFDPQTGNFLVGNCGSPGLLALSNNGTGIGEISAVPAWANVVLPQAQSTPAPPLMPPPPPPPLVLSGGTLPQGFAFEPYSSGVGASGGVPPYKYSASGFPAGIDVNQYTGAIGGQTAQTGTFSVTISVTDSTGAAASTTLSLTVVPPPPVSLTGSNLGSVVVGTPVSLVISASGGAPPYTYALAGGTPPPGLSLVSSGTFRGTPLNAGSYSFSVKATDSTGGSATGAFTMTILPPPLTITSPSPFATGTVSLGYPTQSITAKGGTAPYTFAVTGGSLPAGLSLSSTGMISGTPTTATPSGGTTFTVTATDSAVTPSTGTANLSITVQPFTTNLVLSSGSLAFSLAAGTKNLPPAQSVGVQSTMVTQPINYTVAVQPSSATWLGATSGNTTPGTLSVSLTPAALSLAASTTPYSASVVVTCASSGCSGSSQTIPVSLTVSSPPPVLSVQATTLSFNTTSANPQVTTESLVVSNTGGGGIGFASVKCGAPWCTVSGIPGSLGASDTANLTVTADPTGLGAGYYYTAVSIVSSAGSASVPVTFSIAPNGVISLSPAGTLFTLPQGGLLTPGSFTVGITGTAPINYSASVSSGTFLQIQNGSGSASGTTPGTVTYAFDNSQISKLAPGTYYGTISVTAGGASNSPQSYEIVVNVTPATTPSVPNPTPGGLIFLTQVNATPPPQTISVVSFSTNSTGFQASASTMTGGNWLSAAPASGTTVGGTPGTVNVTANPSGLRPGVYKGAVNFAFAGTTAVRSVNVTLVVENVGSATTPAISSKEHPNAAGTCTPSQLVPASTGLVGNFSAPAAWPVPLAITLVDDCGNLVNNGQIVATFSNGDPPLILTLSDPNAASYAATWTPQHSAGQITINARATAPNLPFATAQIGGAVTPNNAPILADLAIANFYNPIGGAPLSPGTLVQITGQYLAGQTMNAPAIPLPLTLGGTSVIIGGVQAPVSMVSPGQVNVQVPFELPAGQPYQVIVNANSALTTPQSFQAGDASPGLSVLPSGYVQAGHADGTPVTEAKPAKPGEGISIYLVGMGATTIPVASGNPGPSGTFATTTINPQVTINNEAATVSFSGLIPGLVGVYQVNLAVPSDVPNGDLTLALAQNAFTSNSGLLPVHN